MDRRRTRKKHRRNKGERSRPASGQGCQDPTSTSPLGLTGNVAGFRGAMFSYSHFRRTHTSGVLTHLAWARCSRGIRHARRGLFAALLTRLAWARCSRSIRHTRRGLFAAVLTRLACGRCSSWEWWSQCRSRGCRGRFVGRDNRLRGERISRLATAPFLYTFSSLCGITACPQD